MIVKSLRAPRRQHQPGGRVAGHEPGGALPAAGEIRDRGVSLRRGFAAVYLLVVHLLAAAGGRAARSCGQRGWLLALEVAVRASLLMGLAPGARAVRAAGAASSEGAQFLEESDFTARLRATGAARSWIGWCGSTTGWPTTCATSARAWPEQHHFLAQILRRLALGDRDPRLRRRRRVRQPGRPAPAGARGCGAAGRSRRPWPAPLGPALAALAAGEARRARAWRRGGVRVPARLLHGPRLSPAASSCSRS